MKQMITLGAIAIMISHASSFVTNRRHRSSVGVTWTTRTDNFDNIDDPSVKKAFGAYVREIEDSMDEDESKPSSIAGDRNGETGMDFITEALDAFVLEVEDSYDEDDLREAEELREAGRDLTKEIILSTRLPSLGMQRCYLGPDAFGGTGCFASRDISAGEVVTCVPGDLVVHIESDDVVMGPHMEAFAEDGLDFEQLADYQLDEGKEYTVMGLPALRDDPSYLGHFVNDAARLELRDATGFVARVVASASAGTPLESTEEEDEALASYEAESDAKRNAEHTSLHLALVTVATRDIKKGDEVLVSYGASYWTEHALRGERVASAA